MSSATKNSAVSNRLADLFLRYAGPLAGLRRLPVVGHAIGWFSGKLVPRDALTWIQVQRGPAAGLWVRVNPRTGAATLSGTSEPSVQQAFTEHLRSGMTFYDLGANIGFFSLLGARLVGSSGRVVSFEADPEVAVRLRENVGRNNFSWVTVAQLAVWSEPRTVTFARVDAASSPDRGQGHVAADEPGATMISVDAVSLDDYCRAAPPPDFIKCDVEGAELEVLRGARLLFAEKRPIFLCEIHSEENRENLHRELSLLAYRCLDCDATHVLALPQ